jgi:hypothetical protein
VLNKNKIIKGEMKCGAQSKKRLNEYKAGGQCRIGKY